MIISELIIELEKIKEKDWDFNVEVQYRDGWGLYYWTDKELQMEIFEGRLIL